MLHHPFTFVTTKDETLGTMNDARPATTAPTTVTAHLDTLLKQKEADLATVRLKLQSLSKQERELKTFITDLKFKINE